MKIDPPTIDPTSGDSAAVIALALEEARAHPFELDPDAKPIVATHRELIVTDLEQYGTTPRRKRGNLTFHTGASLGEYVNRHKRDATVLYADVLAREVVAVIDDHEPEAAADEVDHAGWAQHRAALKLRHTVEWNHWKSRDRLIEDQVSFAQHIEEGLDEIVAPPGAEMLELAQSIQAQTTAQFKRAVRLDNGAQQIQYEETLDASAGKQGAMKIPDTFELALAPFEGSDKYRVVARLRYRIREGSLTIGYQLVRPELVIQSAFDDVLRALQADTQLNALRGAAPAPR